MCCFIVLKTRSISRFQFLAECIEHSPDIYLGELQTKLQEVAHLTVSKVAISNGLKRIGYTRKKVRSWYPHCNNSCNCAQISKVALEQSAARRASYMLRIGTQYDPRQLVFVDESSFDRRTAVRGFAWALRGEPIPRHHFLSAERGM